MKTVCDKLISGVDMAEQRISGLEAITLETSKTVKQKEQRLGKKKKGTKYQMSVGQPQKV